MLGNINSGILGSAYGKRSGLFVGVRQRSRCPSRLASLFIEPRALLPCVVGVVTTVATYLLPEYTTLARSSIEPSRLRSVYVFG